MPPHEIPDIGYCEALEELRLWFQVNEVPEWVMAGFLGLLDQHQDRLFVVKLDGLTNGAPDLGSHLHASKRLVELVLAARAGTLDWKQIAIFVEHAATPLIANVTEEMIDAGVDCFFDIPVVIEGPSTMQMRDAIKRAFVRMTQVQRKERRLP